MKKRKCYKLQHLWLGTKLTKDMGVERHEEKKLGYQFSNVKSELNVIHALSDRISRDDGEKNLHSSCSEQEIQMVNDTYSLLGSQIYSLSSVSSSFPAEKHDLEQIRRV